MAFKDILVYVDGAKSCRSRLEVAVRLANTHGAHLVGLHVRPLLTLPAAIAPDYGGQLALLQDKYSEETAGTAKGLFDEAVRTSDISVEWRDAGGDVIGTVALHARYVDLVIVGQTDADANDAAVDRHLADHLVLDAGTPVLVVPYVGQYASLGEKVQVAWNSSREATRAVHDALPILERAKLVKVLAINPKDGPSGTWRRSGGRHLSAFGPPRCQRHLRKHPRAGCRCRQHAVVARRRRRCGSVGHGRLWPLAPA